MKIKLIAITALFLVSCSREIEIDFSVGNPKLVLNCLLSPNEPVVANLSSSISILETTFPNIENAQISLFEDDKYITELQYVSGGNYQANYYPKAGSTYIITAKAEGFQQIKATESLLKYSGVDVYGFSFKYPATVIEDITFGKVSFIISDQDNEVTNYYEIILAHKFTGDNQTYYTNYYVSNEVASAKDWDPPYPRTILFTDKSFSGKSIDFSVFVNSETCPIIKVRNVSYSYYMYKTTLYIHQYTQAWDRESIDELFKGEPTEMYSNIVNGYGIFASYVEYVYNPND